MRVLVVTGGRDYRDAKTLRSSIEAFDPDLVIQGGARGADQLALNWALATSRAHATFPADWKRHGNRAGHLRNHAMIEFAAALVRTGAHVAVHAFPGGAGTDHAIRVAKEAGLPVVFPCLASEPPPISE